ncbi:alpha-1,3-mannosyl-glycoprotein 2-beta-N-acetylglucosaminyltransferase-like [Dermacentor silvarum]|uniref:alpha-1,3-mannosyl-glycoprotein 2-beta-N-acetylglucosaminyltransferase-like n=1 Tax=Dermacentor silvarum TaxID=543639 RepID=UPI001898287A|nr:alpha-1,3-mannosyl-glycoprotein 2-beta-N-acetylglucosaminyltransferase-like [Dermacentor silvarum]XP_037572667.1 alpha-1,3-mannosyl-glycoprotein 2-beta-N-acetylglucosaminyltransferase-like [Dermacentor silvarum]XP_037572668.1 alpha-1,3-mannosyl-glycoprotein 2-beta-N-acetylglucosaminyltransferase-like [Dermacentor silvarum]
MRKRNFILFVSLAFLTWGGITYLLFLQRPLTGKVFRPGKVQAQLDLLEQELAEQGRANAKLLGSLRELKEKLRLAQNESHGQAAKDSPVIAVLLFACNRVTVKRPIDQLLQYRPSKKQFPIIVSQDCNHALTSKAIQDYGDQLTLIKQPDQSDIPLLGKEKKFKGYYKIARHYGWALNKTFFEFNYDTVLIVEDDLELSVDFFEYFLALHPILKTDPTLFCVSAWNDNGKAGLVADDPELLHRSDFFPGLGWMMTKDMWVEMSHRWPKAFWDDWIRQPEQRKDRACIRPEVSRTKTFGKIGVSNGLFYEKHLKFIQLNKKFVPFTSKDLSYLKKDNYDVAFVKEVYGSPLVTVSQVLKGSLETKGAIRITYTSKEQFKSIAKKLSIMDDFKSGVPRTGYRGVVSLLYKGRRVYLAPPADWKGYNKSWS